MPLSEHLKPDPLRAPTRAEIERAREMYAQGFTVSRILAACNMSHGTLYYWLDGGPFLAPTTDQSAAGSDAHGGRMLAPIPRQRSIVGKRRKPLAASHASLVARLYRTAERAALDIEQRLAVPSGATPERERDLRMLSQLVAALRGLTAIEPAPAPAPVSQAEAEAEEAGDIDEFREVLARRLQGFIEEQRRADAAAQSVRAGEEAEQGEGARE
jgi:hypothetical protein